MPINLYKLYFILFLKIELFIKIIATNFILDAELYCLNELIIKLKIYVFNAFFYVFVIIIF